jgi:hypothetical protein
MKLTLAVHAARFQNCASLRQPVIKTWYAHPSTRPQPNLARHSEDIQLVTINLCHEVQTVIPWHSANQAHQAQEDHSHHSDRCIARLPNNSLS